MQPTFNEQKYTIDDLFSGDVTQSFGAPEFGNTPSFQNAFSQQIDPNVVGTGEQGENIRNYGVDKRYIVVRPGESIQDAIDKLQVLGGGIVSLQVGNHIVATDITVPRGVYLYGVNRISTILNFNSNAKSVVVEGSGAYSTGTVSISTGGTTVTGSGTSWLANASTSKEIQLDGVWYPIAAVGSDTSITIGVPYAGEALSGDSYIVAVVTYDVHLQNLTVTGSASAAIKFRYARNCVIQNLSVTGSATGFDIDDSANFTFFVVNNTANNTNFDFSNFHYSELGSVGGVNALTGNGATFNNCSRMVMRAFFILNSAADGVSLTDCRSIVFSGTASNANAGQGFELVSGNDVVSISSSEISNNGSDGIKLTATSDNLILSNSTIRSNGAYGINIAASTCDNNIVNANVFESNTSGAKSDSGTNTQFRGNVGITDSTAAFGGDGSDGALSISSGTTTVSLGSAQVVTKNYSSISITGTGKLAFSDPHANGTVIVLKSQGDVTITSSTSPALDASGMGASGGSGGSGFDGAAGTAGASLLTKATAGAGGVNGGAGGAGGTTSALIQSIVTKVVPIGCGAGGGEGSANDVSVSGSGGDGGRGGAALYIECGGNYNATGTLSVAGANGSNSGSGAGNGGGGGGGGGGTIIVLYNGLTADSGTYTVSGGTGGTSGGSAGSAGGGGGAGTATSGSAGSNSPTGTGGNAGNGFALRAENKDFA